MAMSYQTLEALRRLLFYSLPEAARLISASEIRPRGVSERGWRMFESNEKGISVPVDVEMRILDVIHWRDAYIKEIENMDVSELNQAWPGTKEEFKMSYPQLTELYWRPCQSAIAEVLNKKLLEARI